MGKTGDDDDVNLIPVDDRTAIPLLVHVLEYVDARLCPKDLAAAAPGQAGSASSVGLVTRARIAPGPEMVARARTPPDQRGRPGDPLRCGTPSTPLPR